MPAEESERTSEEGSVELTIAEQKAYYRARSGEYDDWWQRQGRYNKGDAFEAAWSGEIDALRTALSKFSPNGAVLELAGGTGNWSRELARHADHLTVVDQSPESLEINRSKLAEAGFDKTIIYIEADLFDFTPPGVFDVVFFSFWQSHVPESRFESFWAMVTHALGPDGRVFLIDNAHPALSENLHHAPIDVHTATVATDQGGSIDLLDGTARRTLADGRSFDIVKRYFRPEPYVAMMADLGWRVEARETEHFFFWANAQRR